MRHTKIVATVGPATDSDAMLDALVSAGADIIRLNFSHGTHQSHERVFRRVRDAAARAGREVAILQDLSGPKIRTGRLKDGRPIHVEPGDRLVIVTGDEPGEPGRVSTTFAGLAASVKSGDPLLLADGLIELRVDACDGRTIETTVVEGGDIGEHKGINAPGVPLAASAITPKDEDNLRFGLSLGIDLVAVSFVQSAADVQRARQLLTEKGAADLPIVAKIERPQAVDHLEEVLAACDAVMVARGDLGLEMPLERVPTVQKTITRLARRRGIPVIVATQVLESMTVEPRPTRAEVNDAANAVTDGVDGIMLSGESAVGKFPIKAVETLGAIIVEAEAAPLSAAAPPSEAAGDHAQAICEAAVTLANRGDAQAIVAVTRSGGTARRLAALRPRAPIIAVCERGEMARRLAIYWGVLPVSIPFGNNLETAAPMIARELVARGVVARGLPVVVVNISPDLAQSDANYLKMRLL